MLLLMLSLLMSNTAQALTQEAERRISIGLNLFPNIISVDTQIKKKLDKDSMIQILFIVKLKQEAGDVLLERFVKKIKTIRKITVKSKVMTLSKLLAITENKNSAIQDKGLFVSALFVAEPLSEAELHTLMDVAKKLQVIVFSPFKGDVGRGATSGLFIGSKIRPYLNMHTIKDSNITFHPLFLKLAHKYE